LSQNGYRHLEDSEPVPILGWSIRRLGDCYACFCGLVPAPYRRCDNDDIWHSQALRPIPGHRGRARQDRHAARLWHLTLMGKPRSAAGISASTAGDWIGGIGVAGVDAVFALNPTLNPFQYSLSRPCVWFIRTR